MTTKMGGACTGLHAVKAYFDSQAENWDGGSHHDPRKLRYILRICDLHAGQRILDVACGTGVLFPWLLAHGPDLLMGIDISEGMTEKARKKYRDKRLRIVTADFYQLEAGNFDRIIMYNAYPHFFDKERLANKTSDLLAAGGRFIVAHNKGRESLNAMHDARGAGECSLPLMPVSMERCWFEPYFIINDCVDNGDMYILSGEKRGSK
jgi:demethylmenaquinone methyltransferase/2-methoxy-6-polyprenyl-1,4-benzoquinol methylase